MPLKHRHPAHRLRRGQRGWALLEGLGSLLGSALGGRLLAVALAWSYLVWLEVSPRGTFGYRVVGARLVDLCGQRVSLWRATLRCLLVALRPASAFLDVLWLSNDTCGQSLRDKIAGTYVIRVSAQPAGLGRITYPSYFIGALSLTVPEVTPHALAGIVYRAGAGPRQA